MPSFGIGSGNHWSDGPCGCVVGFYVGAETLCDANERKEIPMKNARELMLAYLAGTAEETGALFAPGGTLELPYLASIGLPPVLKGPAEISRFLGFLHDTLYPGFAFENVKILIETPEQVFAEYQINHASGISGKSVSQQFFGHLEIEAGKIRRLREAIDVVVAAEAIFPNGLQDVIAKRS
jgi:hypothetical protein